VSSDVIEHHRVCGDRVYVTTRRISRQLKMDGECRGNWLTYSCKPRARSFLMRKIFLIIEFATDAMTLS
jgi:hypothetical protein